MPATPATILLIRHGETGPNTEGRYIGRTDPPLTERGRLQAAHATERAGRIHPAVCLASPLCRTRETAAILCAALQLPLFLDEDLQEIDFGLWEGKTFPEIAESAPEAVADWSREPESFAFPGGENFADFASRISRAASRIASRPEDCVAVVTHGGAFRHLLCQFLGLEPRQGLAFDVRPGALAVVKMTAGLGVLREFANQDTPQP